MPLAGPALGLNAKKPPAPGGDGRLVRWLPEQPGRT
jgi:hypothetical protein